MASKSDSRSTKAGTGKSKSAAQRQKSRRARAAEEARHRRQNHEILGVLFIALGLFLLLAHFSFTGFIGKAISGFVGGLFGSMGAFICIICMFFGVYAIAMAARDKMGVKGALFGGMMVCLASIFHVAYAAEHSANSPGLVDFIGRSFQYGSTNAAGGGFFGALISYPLVSIFGSVPSYLLLIAGIVVLTIAFTNLSLQQGGEKIGETLFGGLEKLFEKRAAQKQRKQKEEQRRAARRATAMPVEAGVPAPVRKAAPPPMASAPKPPQRQNFRMNEITLGEEYDERGTGAPVVREVPQTKTERRQSQSIDWSMGERSRTHPEPQKAEEMMEERPPLPRERRSGRANSSALISDPHARERWDAVWTGSANAPKIPEENVEQVDVVQAFLSEDDASPAAIDEKNDVYYDAGSESYEETLDRLALEALEMDHGRQPLVEPEEEPIQPQQVQLPITISPEKERFLPPLSPKPKKAETETKKRKNGEGDDFDLDMGFEEKPEYIADDVDIFIPPQKGAPKQPKPEAPTEKKHPDNIRLFPGGFVRDPQDSFADLNIGDHPPVEHIDDNAGLCADVDPREEVSAPHIEPPEEHFSGSVFDFDEIGEDDDEPDDAYFEEPDCNDESIEAPVAMRREKSEMPEYIPPSLNLLQMPDATMIGPRENMPQKGMLLEETLKSFGIQAKVVSYEVGPTITRFEVQLAPGVRINKITNLSDDIAMNMGAARVRIAPIPSRAAVGVEIPNREPRAVMLHEVLNSPDFKNNPSRVAVALGKDITGQVIVADLAKMPHLMIAGSTGSGKSVCINTLICSLLYHSKPEQVRMILVDPKVVELASFAQIPHLLIPVVTNPNKASAALSKGVAEMETRYRKFAALGVRDLARYNQVVEREGGYIYKDGSDFEHECMPQLVIIIDELADLMMVAAKEVEDAICRIAQMGRAAGIHLVLATQRPSADVITGLIKANVPSRIAFAVASGTDSRIILDKMGAEKLLGRGDMLFQPIGKNEPLRVQGALVTDDEVEGIREHFEQTQQAAPTFDREFQDAVENGGNEGEGGSEVSDDLDDLLPEAVEMLMQNGQASTSMLQRRMRIGYTRAARMIDQMESMGIVSESEGAKARRILIGREDFERIFGYPPNIAPLGI